MKLTDLRVKTKLMLAFAFLAAIVLLVSALSMRSLGASNDRFANYLASVGERERLATDVRGAATRRAIAARKTAVASIDQGTQQNAALVEQSAAAAESLKQQAAGLLGLVAAFKTADARGVAFA